VSADCTQKDGVGGGGGGWSELGVTLAVEYSDYEFYDVRNTVDSCVLVHGAASRIRQIVAMDSSTLDYIVDDARDYFSRLPRTTLLRSTEVRARRRRSASSDHSFDAGRISASSGADVQLSVDIAAEVAPCFAFSALTLLVGRQEGLPACNN